MILKIYADRSCMPEKERYVSLLFPFWGILPEPEGDKDSGRFDEYWRTGSRHFSLVPSLPEADVAILPFEWKSKTAREYQSRLEIAYRLAKEANAFGKPLIIFFNNDSDELVPIENSIIFRTSFKRSERNPNEYSIPGWSIDFLQRHLGGKLPVRKKSSPPVVGYCGYVDYIGPNKPWRNVLNIMQKGDQRIGWTVRGKAVRALMREKRIRTNIIIRRGFGGHCNESARREYVENIVSSDYCLVARGGGNFSYRLYEVICCGRIPVFIDTDCVLPFDHLLDWKNHCVWIDSGSIESIGTIVAKFHDNLSGTEFEELQRANRKLYEEWISPMGFYGKLWKCLYPDSIG